MMRFIKIPQAKHSKFWRRIERMIHSGQMIIVFLITLITAFLLLLPG